MNTDIVHHILLQILLHIKQIENSHKATNTVTQIVKLHPDNIYAVTSERMNSYLCIRNELSLNKQVFRFKK